MTNTLTTRYEQVKTLLAKHNQSQLLRFYDELSEEEQTALLDQIEAYDWDTLSDLIKTHVLNEPNHAPDSVITPAPYYPATPKKEDEGMYEHAKTLGVTLLKQGNIAAFTVAGGQGSRLGWDAPKGTFPATPIKKKSLFQVFAEMIRKTQQKYDTIIPWYIMTSTVNDADTRAFFKQHNYFELHPDNVQFFPQGTLPSIGFNGDILLADKSTIAVNPDGHGGSLNALKRSGALNDMQQRGITQISYFQVDNPNVKPFDPLFIGLHANKNADMSSKMLTKKHAKERVGNFCMVNNRMSVIEYSDMPDELAQQKDENGNLKFNAGSIAIHLISVDFVKQLTSNKNLSLPYHRAEKKVPHLDLTQQQTIEPQKPNAVKLELFIFDALPLAKESILLQTERVEEFAPIKNAEGDDSPATSRELQSERAARWLEAAGVKVARKADGSVDAVIELSPLTATEQADLVGLELPDEIKSGEEIVL